MAEGGDHPLAPRRPGVHRVLSRDDIGNQGRYLLTQFIHDRLQAEGYEGVRQLDHLIEPGTPAGPPLDHVREVASCLKKIGDELDSDESLQRLIHQITPDSPQQTFLKVAKEIFADGKFNWGRVVALFYFGFKMILKAIEQKLNDLPFLRSIVEWIVHYIIDYVAPWIIDRGGWESIQEYFGATTIQTAGVLAAGALISAFLIWRS